MEISPRISHSCDSVHRFTFPFPTLFRDAVSCYPTNVIGSFIDRPHTPYSPKAAYCPGEARYSRYSSRGGMGTGCIERESSKWKPFGDRFQTSTGRGGYALLVSIFVLLSARSPLHRKQNIHLVIRTVVPPVEGEACSELVLRSWHFLARAMSPSCRAADDSIRTTGFC